MFLVLEMIIGSGSFRTRFGIGVGGISLRISWISGFCISIWVVFRRFRRRFSGFVVFRSLSRICRFGVEGVF